MVTETRRVMGTPIVLERAKKGKKKKPRLKDADTFERNLYRAARRTVDAADKGMRRYGKARRKSARRERDGALIDLVPNVTKGMVSGSAKLALVPLDLLRAGWPRSMRRTTRGTVRTAARVIERS